MKKSVLVFLFCVSVSSASANYEVVDLGTFEGGSHSFATSINNAGKVCGYAYTKTSVQAFISDITAVPQMTKAYDIGENGVIVGISLVRNIVRPSVHRNGRTYLLGTLDCSFGYANAIKNNIIVGSTGKRYGNIEVARPCLWIDRRPLELFHQPGAGWASDISHGRQIVGTFFPGDQGPLAFLWQRGRAIFLGPGYASAISLIDVVYVYNKGSTELQV